MREELIGHMTRAALAQGYRLFCIGELGHLVPELLATPWIKGASDADKLISTMADAIGIGPSDVHVLPDGNYGRVGYILSYPPEQFVVSVMPRYATFRIAMSSDLAAN
ncbi:MAG: hypothetical protein KGZ68_00885 [Dechloromonas sp.]|jgi:hypothetical protein|nr:hypothetical protein [Dechloromonas sp.]